MAWSKEEVKEYNKKYREKNVEKLTQTSKDYYEKNKEQMLNKMKEYRETHKEERKEHQKEYYVKNYDKVREQQKKYSVEYRKTDAYKKSQRLRKWKLRGVVCEDWNALYDLYVNCWKCQNCDCDLIEGNYGNNKRCLDHDHKTGLFRNILCNTCNIKIS